MAAAPAGTVHRNLDIGRGLPGFTTLIAFGLVWYCDLAALGGTTALLLLVVVTIVNVVVLVLRRDQVEDRHSRSPTVIPVVGALACKTGRAPRITT